MLLATEIRAFNTGNWVTNVETRNQEPRAPELQGLQCNPDPRLSQRAIYLGSRLLQIEALT